MNDLSAYKKENLKKKALRKGKDKDDGKKGETSKSDYEDCWYFSFLHKITEYSNGYNIADKIKQVNTTGKIDDTVQVAI